MMNLVRFMDRSEIIEKYAVPAELEDEIFGMLKPVNGAGQAARYFEPVVDSQLTQFFKNKLRVMDTGGESSLVEDKRAVDVAVSETVERLLAACLERFAGLQLPAKIPVQRPEERVLTPAEAAKQMRLHKQTVARWCREGKLGVKAGRKWFIRPDEVKQYLRGQLLIKGTVAG